VGSLRSELSDSSSCALGLFSAAYSLSCQTMKLYCFPVAPNPTKLRLYLAEKNAGGAAIPIEEVEVNLVEGAQKDDDFLVRNPFARLPVLELDDGEHLTESLAIIEYLEESFPTPPMLGTTALERARTRSLERMIEWDILASIARYVHATNSPLGLPPLPQVASDAAARAWPGFKFLESVLSDGRPFLLGPTPTVADCTLAAALQFGRFGEFPFDPKYERVQRWDETYRRREPARSVLVF
jgi:glutathione S-transferase